MSRISSWFPKKRLKGNKPLTLPKHRLTTKILNRNLIILDNAYSSNPLCFKKALETLKNYPRYQKIVVTPGIIEAVNKQFNFFNLQSMRYHHPNISP
ncbi:hypothetical protein COT63_00660 [Candidatus Shapirobacteria bacterium CG09_land_8_20_14_0_10_38_17]|uniref:Uncharacterized protein n=1 Tax=Candidatus Shapirobacteria bacterium CG09_land_8_20_14_0_10_38_17 TaxID=1974884 RepID=A0A2H0WRR3_9BACT|nr:MAG: hypothetical protein COT63_00660 [Candidatus Shapirobacteria bacterium CG09_land_8_20_14_0_10_38_17]